MPEAYRIYMFLALIEQILIIAFIRPKLLFSIIELIKYSPKGMSTNHAQCLNVSNEELKGISNGNKAETNHASIP